MTGPGNGKNLKTLTKEQYERVKRQAIENSDKNNIVNTSEFTETEIYWLTHLNPDIVMLSHDFGYGNYKFQLTRKYRKERKRLVESGELEPKKRTRAKAEVKDRKVSELPLELAVASAHLIYLANPDKNYTVKVSESWVPKRVLDALRGERVIKQYANNGSMLHESFRHYLENGDEQAELVALLEQDESQLIIEALGEEKMQDDYRRKTSYVRNAFIARRPSLYLEDPDDLAILGQIASLVNHKSFIVATRTIPEDVLARAHEIGLVEDRHTAGRRLVFVKAAYRKQVKETWTRQGLE